LWHDEHFLPLTWLDAWKPLPDGDPALEVAVVVATQALVVERVAAVVVAVVAVIGAVDAGVALGQRARRRAEEVALGAGRGRRQRHHAEREQRERESGGTAHGSHPLYQARSHEM
jgi:hypothetical protein